MSDDAHTWEVLSSERVLERPPYVTLRKDAIRLPDGATIGDYWVIENPPWANVVAITTGGEVVLVRQYRHGSGRVGLEIPGGYVEEGEDPLAAAQRELLEETGYGGGEWTSIFTLAPNPALMANEMHCFAAVGVELVGERNLDDNEDLSVELHPSADISALIRSGEIHHALHVAPLLAYVLGSNR